MKFIKKRFYGILLIGAILCEITTANAAPSTSCPVRYKKVKTCGTVSQSSCCPTRKVIMKKSIPDRSGKLRHKYTSDTRLLKEIHQRQKQFLSKYDGEKSRVSQKERQYMADLVAQLPAFLQTSNSYFFDRMMDIEQVVYDIYNKKIEYKSKKKLKKPIDVLEDIQKKQRRYLVNYQAREYKKRLKK